MKQKKNIKLKIETENKNHNQALERISKRAQIILSEISELRQSIPEVEASIRDQFQLLKSEVVQLTKHLDAVLVESKTISKLEEYRRGINQQKNKLIHKLVELHKTEIKELKELKMNKLK